MFQDDKTDKEIFDETNDRFETIKNMAVTNTVKETEVKINKTSKPEATEPVFSTKEEKEEFNKWYYETTKKSNGKKKGELYDVPSKCDWEENGHMYKQLRPISEVSDKQKPSTTTFDSSSILFYLQAVFILLIAGHKSLNTNLLKIAKHS